MSPAPRFTPRWTRSVPTPFPSPAAPAPAPARRAPRTRRALGAGAALALAALALVVPTSAPAAGAFLHFKHNTTVGSTVPPNGDLNPYGIDVVPQTTGALVAGDTLISNFNNGGEPPTGNQQGTGTTIVELSPRGKLKVFAQLNAATLPGPCPGGVGLTTALSILPQGYVVVGSLPTTNGSAETAQAGCLILLNSNGTPVETISGPPINGPWDMTAVNAGATSTLFVTNVLNGTVASGETPIDEGTVVRLRVRIVPNGPPRVAEAKVIATGFPERTDEAALVVGPTGVALGGDGTLYVADTQDNRIAAVKNALGRGNPVMGGGATVTQGGFLNAPLGMTIAPNGDILTANGGDGNIVETTPEGAQFPPFDTGAGGGGLFGVTINASLNGVLYVNDAENTLGLLH